jgi:outer membrane protein TolC
MSLHTIKLSTPLAGITRCAGCSVNAMGKPVGTARSFRPSRSGGAPWFAYTPACLIIAMLVLATGVIGWHGPAQGADQRPVVQTLPPGAQPNYDEAAKIAINQSNYFAKSSLDIDIRRMDEADSRYGMVPPLTFRTVYYVNRPQGSGGKPYFLSFSTEPYNPLGAYFTLKAQKLVTQVAVLTHLQVISLGLERVGDFYLELETLQKVADCQKDLIQVARENLTYAENRLSIGTGTSLEVKVARQQLELAMGERETIALSLKRVLSSLKNFIGVTSTQDFTPNFRDSRRQVMGKFDPATTTAEQAKTRSYELKALELQKELQNYHIRLAKSKVLPTIVFNTQTPSPLSISNGQGLYVGFGLEIPVWDGFKRIRNVSREKTVMKQLNAHTLQKESSIEDKWLAGLEIAQQTRVALKNAQTMENLARLKAHQNEIRYQSGEAPLPVFLDSRKEILTVQKETLRRGLDYDKAVLNLRQISGDLGYSYVDTNSFQK